MKEKLQTRMYCLVNRSLSSIQKGIQAGHAIVEYGLKHPTNEYFKWAFEDKTVIILDGGTSNEEPEVSDSHSILQYVNVNKWKVGDMENHIEWLKSNRINYSEFKEPDLNNCLTAIAFIVDERVYDYEKYPDFEDVWTCNEITKRDEYLHWLFTIGGETNEKLREFLKQFKLSI